MEKQRRRSDSKYKHSIFNYSIQFTVFQERNFVVIQTKSNKHIVYSLINRVEVSSHPCALAQRQK